MEKKLTELIEEKYLQPTRRKRRKVVGVEIEMEICTVYAASGFSKRKDT